MSWKNYRYFTCHRYDIDISKKPISEVPIRYRYRYVDIGDISTIFSIYRPTSTRKRKTTERSDLEEKLFASAVTDTTIVREGRICYLRIFRLDHALSYSCSFVFFKNSSSNLIKHSNIIIIIIIIIIINDSIYPAVSKASRTGNKVSCQPNDCPNR